MGKILAINFTETARSRLCVVLAILNFIAIIASAGMIFLGAYIKIQIQSLDHIYVGYDNNILPWVLIAIGVLCMVVNIMGGMCIFTCHDPNKRLALKYILVIHMVMGAVACIGVLVGGTMCFISGRQLDDAFSKGIVEGMMKYSKDPIAKTEIDKLQINYECCGNEEYMDWFRIPWILDKYYKVITRDSREVKSDAVKPAKHQIKEVKSDAVKPVKHQIQKASLHGDDDAVASSKLHDAVPFSCCDPSAPRPCVHMFVHQKHKEYNFVEDITLYTKGCRDAIMDYFADTMLIQGGACVFGIFVLQVRLLKYFVWVTHIRYRSTQ